MSKTFKSTMTDNRELEVDVIFSNPRLLIKESGNGRSGFVFAPSDAPDLALAILEAAGVPWNVDTALGRAAVELDKHVTTEAKRTAEARELAELEAEALGLYLACFPNHAVHSFAQLRGKTGDQWLAVARRAREMRAEK